MNSRITDSLEVPHHPTIPRLPKLSQKKHAAMTCILAGGSITQAGQAAGVRRETVSRWVHGDAEFLAEMNRRRAELWSGSMDKLRGLLPDAIDALRDVLQMKGAPTARLRAADLVLRTLRVADEAHVPPTARVAPRTAEGVVQAWEEEEERAREAEELRRMLAPVLALRSS